MLSFFYNLIVQPLVLTIEIIFVIMYRVLRNAGFAIVGVSLVVNFLILPLYRRADALQEAERNKQDSMRGWVDHIKKTFRGDEQYMLLQTYYRQQGYHPLYALKSSVSLLLQIPFFIAAYRFLSDLTLLNGTAFGPIRDLGSPDGMLTIAGLTVNVLPLLMTAVNLLSGAIYSRGFPLSSKIQQLVLTLLFLVLLYNRPAGLVMYWTLNNIFSLGKNIFNKVLRHPREIFAILAALFGVCVSGFLYGTGRLWSPQRTVLTILMLILTLLPLLRMVTGNREISLRGLFPGGDGGEKASVFILGGVFLTLLVGFIIPLAVISDSPMEFANLKSFVNPIRFALGTMVITAGFLMLWGGIFYALSSGPARRIFSLVYWLLALASTVNYMFFGRNLGDLSTELTFDDTPSFTRNEVLFNMAVLLLLMTAGYLLWRFAGKLIARVYVIAALGLAGLAVFNIYTMQKTISSVENLTPASETQDLEVEPLFRLSRTGKNVIIVMMDRAIGAYLPYVMKQRPELEEKLSGFTWYPNTISYGQITNYGSPGLFGGYEYTPVEMNRRSEELLVDKQNELLKMMPVMYLNEGYEVTVCDPPYAGYELIPDLSIFDDYPEIKAYYTNGKYTAMEFGEFLSSYEDLQTRNFFFYSILKASPVAIQTSVYDDGNYFASSDATTVEPAFLNAYSALKHLVDFTEITEEQKDTFLCFTNKTTHDDTLLQMPDFELSLHVDNSDYIDPEVFNIDGVKVKMTNKKKGYNGKRFAHFCAYVRSFMELCKWFDYMRENGVYDNTRIIISSDHGYRLGQFENLKFDKGRLDAEMLNCLLMVKDFGAEGFHVSDEFMTNADVPTIATKDVIENPVNPFTGNPVNNDEKYAHPQIVTTSHNWKTTKNNGTMFKAKKETWYSVEKNIFDEENWTRIGKWKDVTALLEEQGQWP